MPSPATIRQLRISLGLTQAQAGALIDAAVQVNASGREMCRTWQDWESGRRNMPTAKWELFQRKIQEGIMTRMYLVDEGGSLEMVDRVVIGGVPVTQAGYPMERTERTRELVGWPDKHVREWETDSGNVYLVPEKP